MYGCALCRSTMIGDRMNGLKDGVSNKWFATFDLCARRVGPVCPHFFLCRATRWISQDLTTLFRQTFHALCLGTSRHHK